MKNLRTISIEKIHPFEGHPYKVIDNDEMNAFIESIQQQGIMTPLIIRPIENSEDYEIISGHRRFRAAQKAGLCEVPAFIYAVNRDEAAIMVVDSNLHREHILPSEKAFAYKLKMDALSHQGASCQVGTKLRSDEIIAENTDESARQVQRYIRLTHLIPELLNLMDEGKIAFSVGVELSYLERYEQEAVLEAIELEDKTPSYAQAVALKKASQNCTLDNDYIHSLIAQEKPNQREKISFQYDEISKFFPKQYTLKDIYNHLLRLAEEDYRRRKRNMDRGDRC